MIQQRRNGSDLNPDDFTKKTDEHDKLLNALEKRVGTNEKFGKTFAEASLDSKSLEAALAQTFVGLLQQRYRHAASCGNNCHQN